MPPHRLNPAAPRAAVTGDRGELRLAGGAGGYSERLGAFFLSAFRLSALPAALLDTDRRILCVNDAMNALLGVPELPPQGRKLEELFGFSDRDPILDVAAALQVDRRSELDVRLQLGSLTRPHRLVLTRPSPDAGCLVAELHERRGESSLAATGGGQAGYSAIGLALMREGVIETDELGLVVGMNERAEELTGWPRARALGQTHERVLRLLSPEGPSRNPVRLCLQGGAARISSEHQSLTRDGRRLNLRCSAGALLRADGDISGAVVVFEDYTRMSLLSEELAYRSTHDPITGLLNRDEFERRVNLALARSRSEGTEHLLCYIDLDQFKIVNDVHGHFAGDEMLRQIAGVFRASLRPEDALARLGGDEFGVLLENIRVSEGMPLLESLLEAASNNRFVWEGQSFGTTASMGAVTLNPRTPDSSRAMSLADAACHAAKEDGRNRVRLAEDNDEAARRYNQMSMVARINRALDHNQFSLYYEDVVRADALGEVVYRELLLRIRGDRGEIQPPAEFIAAAERYYMMSALDRWVVNAALDGIAWRNDGIIYALNISGLSLGDRRFLDYVVERIHESGVMPQQLCFEITETAAITHLSEARAFIERLAELGCRFALDDFGSGMASFSYLRNLPVHYLKIDGSFVRSMQANKLDRGMVEAINRIGHDMGLKTIAEHVEDQELIDALRGIGVDWIQGHAISKARPFEELLGG